MALNLGWIFPLTKSSKSPRLEGFSSVSASKRTPPPRLPPWAGRVSGPRSRFMPWRRESEPGAGEVAAALEGGPGAPRVGLAGGRSVRDADRDVEWSRIGAAPDERRRPRSAWGALEGTPMVGARSSCMPGSPSASCATVSMRVHCAPAPPPRGAEDSWRGRGCEVADAAPGAASWLGTSER